MLSLFEHFLFQSYPISQRKLRHNHHRGPGMQPIPTFAPFSQPVQPRDRIVHQSKLLEHGVCVSKVMPFSSILFHFQVLYAWRFHPVVSLSPAWHGCSCPAALQSPSILLHMAFLLLTRTSCAFTPGRCGRNAPPCWTRISEKVQAARADQPPRPPPAFHESWPAERQDWSSCLRCCARCAGRLRNSNGASCRSYREAALKNDDELACFPSGV